jgi:hypothetical protein
MRYISLEELDDAERELVWYLQHEKFDEKRERKLRAICCKLREQIQKQNAHIKN